jgi:hypothetical protein
MGTFNNLISSPPEKLYHYTTNDGLLGIIGNKEIWATKIKYLNDRKELLEAIDNVSMCLMSLEIKYKLTKDFIEKVMRIIKSFQDQNICIVSFSEYGDLLSQWRAYGGNDAGYSIGFNSTALLEIAKENKMYLCKCVYDPNEQNEIIKKYLEKNIEKLKENDSDEFWGGKLAEFYRIATLIKNQSFSEENEWRMLSSAKSCMSANFNFRKGQFTIIPYYSVKFKNEYLSNLIPEIVCGPNPDFNLAKNALELFAMKNKFKKIRIIPSKIPLRKI